MYVGNGVDREPAKTLTLILQVKAPKYHTEGVECHVAYQRIRYTFQRGFLLDVRSRDTYFLGEMYCHIFRNLVHTNCLRQRGNLFSRFHYGTSSRSLSMRSQEIKKDTTN